MAKQNPYITAVRVERPATRSAADLRRADQALLERYQAVMRNPDQAVIRDFVTGRSEQHWPMATRNPPRYNLGAIIISAALVWASILGAVWLVMN